MNILVIGSGGREHAIYWKLKQSKEADNIFLIPGNGGTDNNFNIETNNFPEIEKFCQKKTVDFILVGPEQPLAKGIVDYFQKTNIKILGPDKAAARLESSKIYAKNFMKKYGVVTADFNLLANRSRLEEEIEKKNGNIVLKYDGLAGGKGVFVCSNQEEAMHSLTKIYTKFGDDAKIFCEEKLSGQELSIIGFTDGKQIKLLQPSQDHKQLLENDLGPNTGGMGAYTPVPFCDQEMLKQIKQQIVKPTLRGIQKEKLNFKGIIYFGLIITESGPKLLEYNVRLGDPETEVILPALKNDFLELCLSCLTGNLSEITIECDDKYYVDVILVSGGYPLQYRKGYEIKGLDTLAPDTLVFHAGTKRKNNSLITNGGRVLNIVCADKSFEAAKNKVYQEVKKVNFEDIYYRKDIGNRL